MYAVITDAVTFLFNTEEEANAFAVAASKLEDKVYVATPWDGDSYITIYKPIAGWKAVQYSKDPECDNMFTPGETGMCGWETNKQAYAEAIMWAEAIEVPVMFHRMGR